MGDLAHLPCVLALALVPVLARAQALALVHAQAFAQFQWCLVFRGSDNPRPEMARPWAPPTQTSQNQSKIVSFLNPFSNAFLDRFLVHFASQLASQNPLKCLKNRCQDAFHLGLHVWIDFWLIFAPNLDPLNPIWH